MKTHLAYSPYTYIEKFTYHNTDFKKLKTSKQH